MSQHRMLAVSDAINVASESELSDPARKSWKAKLIHVSGFQSYLDPAVQILIDEMDLIIVQRNVIAQQVIDAMMYFQGLGKPVCVDLDDYYQGLLPNNPAYPFWRKNSSKLDPAPLVMLERGLSLSSGLISPNRILLQDWSYATKGYYIQNYAEGKFWLPEVDLENMRKIRGISKDRIIIGWGGSVSHYDSFWGSGVREAATRLSKRYPELLWMICGNDPRIHAQLPVPSIQKFMQPGVVPSDWPKVVKMFDIGVAPLFGPYDQRRSWIKGMEYMLAGIPWVGTGGEPYGDLSDWGTLIKNSPEAWEDALNAIIKNLSAIKVVTQARIPMARKLLLIENNLHVHEKVYAEIIGNFDQGRGQLPGIVYIRKAT